MTRRFRGAQPLLALLAALLALALSGCGYWVVEDAPIQVGNEIYRVTPAPSAPAQS